MTVNQNYQLDQVKPVTEVLKNTLIMTDENLKKIDFDELLLIQFPIYPEDTHIELRLDTKQNSESLYKLETNQTFLLPRFTLDAALQLAGIVDRTYKKNQFDTIKEQLEKVGILTLVSGDVKSVAGNAVYRFTLTNRNQDETIKARFYDMTKEDEVEGLKDALFYGYVDFTFTGDLDEPTQPDEPDQPWLDLDKVFTARNLGKIVLSSKEIETAETRRKRQLNTAN